MILRMTSSDRMIQGSIEMDPSPQTDGSMTSVTYTLLSVFTPGAVVTT